MFAWLSLRGHWFEQTCELGLDYAVQGSSVAKRSRHDPPARIRVHQLSLCLYGFVSCVSGTVLALYVSLTTYEVGTAIPLSSQTRKLAQRGAYICSRSLSK